MSKGSEQAPDRFLLLPKAARQPLKTTPRMNRLLVTETKRPATAGPYGIRRRRRNATDSARKQPTNEKVARKDDALMVSKPSALDWLSLTVHRL